MSRIFSILFLLLSVSTSAFAKEYQFPTIPKGSYECKEGSIVGTDDIPPTRTQALENCYSYPATCLADFDNCKTKKLSCSNLGPAQRYSVYDVMRLGLEPPKGLPENDRDTYDRISPTAPGSTFRSLENLIMHFGRAATEACAPVDVFVSKMGSAKAQQQYQDEMWQKLENVYKKYRAKVATCPDESCAAYNAQVTAQEYLKDPNVKLTNQQMLVALAEKSYEQFLSKLLVPEKCMKASQTLLFQDQSARIKGWPQQNENIAKAAPPVQKIIDILGNQKKIAALEGICMVDPKPSSIANCPTSHSVVVHKYCEMCKPGGKDCKKAIQIQNSWGQSWQDANNDGWMDAEALLGQTGYKENYTTLIWIEGSSK